MTIKPAAWRCPNWSGSPDHYIYRDADDCAVNAKGELCGEPLFDKQTVETLETDALRYRKLQRWMSSNVKEGWGVVEQLGAVAAWQGWDEMDQFLDSLEECNVGLCETKCDPTQTL